MPSYYYHLKFELYPSPDPSAPLPSSPEDLWIPSPGATLFDNLPSHPRQNYTVQSPRQQQKSAEAAIRLHHNRSGSSSSASVAAAAQQPSNSRSSSGGVIDCGASRAAGRQEGEGEGQGNFVRLSERQWRERAKSFPPPSYTAGIGPRTAGRDWRFARLSVESFDMAEPPRSAGGDNGSAAESPGGPTPAASLGPTLGGAGQATRARYIPLETKNTEIGWGIVHLYREGEQSQPLEIPARLQHKNQQRPAEAADGEAGGGGGEPEGDDGDKEEGTILCIPAVPSYLSPNDFLGFVGEKWRRDVSHYRMVMTSRMNRYMVLMKFRDGQRAKEWREEFDGKVFNSMEAEICHVTYIKSITIETPNQQGRSRFSESSSGVGAVSSSLKPFPPPTPSLIELPTCPVCLERMDDTTGLMTILCQHVFHCTCLQTWKGSGCPVCRATNPSLLTATSSSSSTDPYSNAAYDPSNPYMQPFGKGASNLCSVCDCDDDLWICLICGNVGCGRYKGGHAKEHWKETAHSFSLELETQHVWDYAGDMWVHRLIRDKGDGKVVELPGRSMANGAAGGGQGGQGGGGGGGQALEDDDVVPRAKLERIGMEYTHLLTSQLESQRVYFEEMVSKAADKAAKASASAESAAAQATEALQQLRALRAEHDTLVRTTVPSLERDVERERRRADKAAELARTLSRSLQEEKKVSEGLMARIGHLDHELEAARRQADELRREGDELREMNRDLSMFISGQEKLRELEEEGKVRADEVEEGTVSVPEPPPEEGSGSKRKGKGKRR